MNFPASDLDRTERGLYGATGRSLSRFGGGLVLDTSPLEIGPDQSPACENVDLSYEFLRKRLGRVAYNAVAPVASKVWGVHAYYTRSNVRTLLMQAGSKVYADTTLGTFPTEVLTGLTAGRPMDFVQWRDIVYLGNGQDVVYKWTGSGSATAVTVLTAPTYGAPDTVLLLDGKQTVLEAFDSATSVADGNYLTGWFLVGTSLAEAADTVTQRDGTAIKFTASAAAAEGAYWRKRWSSTDAVTASTTINDAGGISDVDTTLIVASAASLTVGDYLSIEAERVRITVIASNTLTITRAAGGTTAAAHADGVTVSLVKLDLSTVDELIFWVYADKAKQAIQVAALENSGLLTWSSFPILTVAAKATWQQVRVPLAAVSPGNRTASPGFAVKFVDDGEQGYTGSNRFWLDDMKGQGPLPADQYSYYATYAIADGNGNITSESAPSTVQTITLDSSVPFLGINVTVTGTAATGVNKVRIYRYRRNGSFSQARHVATLANPGAGLTVTYLDRRSDADLLLNGEPELTFSRLAPPVAYTYAVVNNRLLAGNVNITGTQHPWRVYLSRVGFPEEFSGTQEPDDPAAAGWFDLGTPDHIFRIIEFEGMALIFTDRSVWTLEGSGWDDFTVRKRADVGLGARECVCVSGRVVYFLAHDGLRAILPRHGHEDQFPTWVVSEPVASRLRAIPDSKRADCCMGVDEWGRVQLSLVRAGQTVADAALVFDPSRPGALSQDEDPLRQGWTYYTNWGFSVLRPLKKGGGDFGQLMGGDPATGKVHYLARNSAGVELETDDAAAIAWSWRSRDESAGPGQRYEWVYVTTEFDQGAASQSVTLTPFLDGAASATTFAQTGGGSAGVQFPVEKRTGCAIRARRSGLKISGSHSVLLSVQAAVVGYHERR